MTRFLLLFIVLLAICLALMAAMLSQYGYSLFAPEMRSMLLVAFLVAGYVAFRISRVIARRKVRLADSPQPGGAGKSKLSGLFSGKSSAQAAREARVATKRKRLVEAGKLADEPVPEPEEAESAPVRVAHSAPIQDRMAARAERVRRAKAAGKLD
ncbi:MAG: hypothetical protein R3265_01240 [Hyphomonas sp.]|nr:hypothetical protein [Hyphomonas sp.]